MKNITDDGSETNESREDLPMGGKNNHEYLKFQNTCRLIEFEYPATKRYDSEQNVDVKQQRFRPDGNDDVSNINKTEQTGINDNVNISNFLSLKVFLKNNAKGYKPKKAFTLKWDQIMRFMTEASDCAYLAMKIIIIDSFVSDIEKLDAELLVSIHYHKNEYPGQFIIGKLFYNKVQQYISLRSSDHFSDRFFIQYRNDECTRQAIGRHKTGEVPERVASYLKLEHPERYTGHCVRRSAATLFSDSGTNMQMIKAIKQLARWRSDMIAQCYIENSMHNRQLIYEGITHEAPMNTSSININMPHAKAASNGATHRELIEISSTNPVAENATPLHSSASSSSKLFLSKPSVKVNFNNQV
ncbi:hypothetical protein TSAR_013514 [Trichomalopsis sarcophagae]|uniref:Tyr recombinase domain-containing protein n=1 Tax=Trichomalopsis sarcophagae TaxID=543379 RepID=A0A232FH37_9HYME|nr:hypothetical protein TSAR_013514 [Trichomalopsis sarcophagae]